MSEPVTLEQVAAEREKVRRRLERSRELVALLTPDYEEARRNVREDEGALARVELALRTAKRAHLIAAAVEALGIETDDPPIIVVSQRVYLPDVFELAAVTDGGVGLYLRRAQRQGRGGGKTHALRTVHVPQAVLGVLAEQAALTKVLGVNNGERIALRERLGELTSPTAVYEVGHVHGSEELVSWQDRGKGDFGAGSGARKPLPPPGGGRWRWLKVADGQAELAAAT